MAFNTRDAIRFIRGKGVDLREEGEGMSMEMFSQELQRSIMTAMSPIMEHIQREGMKRSSETQSIIKALQNIEVKPIVNVQKTEVNVPEIRVPTPQVTVEVPSVAAPNIKVNPTPITIKAPEITVHPPEITEVGLRGIDREHPLPVINMDLGGKPLINVVSGGGGRTLPRKERVQAPKTDGKIEIGSASTAILGVNIERHTFTIVNDGDETVYLTHGLEASVNSGIRLNPNGGSYSNDVYTGPIAGCTGTVANNVTVLEL